MNLKQEFEAHVKEYAFCEIKCAYIVCRGLDPPRRSILGVGFTPEDYVAFIKSIDYESGYNTEGIVWYKTGSWSEIKDDDRGLYWEFMQTPAIPEILL